MSVISALQVTEGGGTTDILPRAPSRHIPRSDASDRRGPFDTARCPLRAVPTASRSDNGALVADDYLLPCQHPMENQ
jgi:hypothetical protein